MRVYHKKIIRLITLTLMLGSLIWIMMQAGPSSAQGDAPSLFTPIVSVQDLNGGLQVRANPALLSQPRLRLTVGPVDYIAVQNISETTRPNHWIGQLEGHPHSHVLFTTQDGVLAGLIHGPEGEYHIHHDEAGIYTIHPPEHIHQSCGFDSLATAEMVTAPATDDLTVIGEGVRLEPVTDQQSTSLIDVLLLYDSDVATELGGEAGVKAYVDLMTLYANRAYRNSDIDLYLRIILAPIDYDGDSTRDALYTIRDSTEVATLRDTYRADLVSILLNETSGACGIAFLNGEYSAVALQPAFSVPGFSVSCGIPVFAHEIGHNLGSEHDWYVAENNDLVESIAHGHIHPTGLWRTIMAYDNECDNNWPDASCQMVPYFSNPRLTLANEPLGVPTGTSTSCTAGNPDNPACDADNATLFNQNGPIVADYRQADTSASTHKIYLPILLRVGPSCTPDPLRESDDIADAVRICPNRPVTGQVDWDAEKFPSSDTNDLYKITLNRGQTVIFYLEAAGNEPGGLSIYPPGTTTINGVTSNTAASGAGEILLPFIPDQTGDWYLAISPDTFEVDQIVLDYQLTVIDPGQP